jgi:excisionase family DNA binding protein
MEGEILTTKELCAYLKLPKTTIYKLCKLGRIPYVKAGKQLRFRKESVDNWLKQEEKIEKRRRR